MNMPPKGGPIQKCLAESPIREAFIRDADVLQHRPVAIAIPVGPDLRHCELAQRCSLAVILAVQTNWHKPAPAQR
jgi:hypothetical protein